MSSESNAYPSAQPADDSNPEWTSPPIGLVLDLALRGDVVTLGRVACVCKEWRLEARKKHLWRGRLAPPKRISDAALKMLVAKHGSGITQLDLSYCPNLTSECVSSLRRCARLEALDVKDTLLSALKLGTALKGKNLDKLTVVGMRDKSRGRGLDALRECIRSPEALDVAKVCETRGCRSLSYACQGCKTCLCESCIFDGDMDNVPDTMFTCAKCNKHYCESCAFSREHATFFSCEICDVDLCDKCAWDGKSFFCTHLR